MRSRRYKVYTFGAIMAIGTHRRERGGFALVVTIAWAFAAKKIGASFGASPIVASVVFSVGAWLMTAAIATGFVYGIVRVYDRFDPSQDAPAVS